MTIPNAFPDYFRHFTVKEGQVHHDHQTLIFTFIHAKQARSFVVDNILQEQPQFSWSWFWQVCLLDVSSVSSKGMKDDSLWLNQGSCNHWKLLNIYI